MVKANLKAKIMRINCKLILVLIVGEQNWSFSNRCLETQCLAFESNCLERGKIIK